MSDRAASRKWPAPMCVGVDKFIRTLGFYQLAQSSYDALSKDAQARLDAYADGVNAYLKPHERRAAGRIPADRRDARALEARRFAGLAEADGLAVEPQPRPGDRARGTRRQAAGGSGRLVDAEPVGGRADHHGARTPSRSRRARRSRDASSAQWSAVRARRLQPMGGRRLAHDDRQADPRQRSASRNRRAVALVSGAHRHARRNAGRRDRARPADRAARPQQTDRLGHHLLADRHAGSVRRDRSIPPIRDQLSDAGRTQSRSRRATRRSM